MNDLEFKIVFDREYKKYREEIDSLSYEVKSQFFNDHIRYMKKYACEKMVKNILSSVGQGRVAPNEK